MSHERNGASHWAPSRGWLGATSDDEQVSLSGVFLLLMTLLAALVRFYHLGHQSLWVDEIMTWWQCRPGAGLRFWQQVSDTIQGPLYIVALWPLVRIDCSEIMLRLPAAVAGVAAVPIFGLAAARLFPSRTARLAVLLLAVSPFHLWYSQEARGYAFMILFSVAATLLFLVMAERGPRPWSAILFGIFSACAIWSNMSALFLWAAHGLTLIAFVQPRTRAHWGLWILAFACGLVAALPWLLKASGIWAVGRLSPSTATGVALRGDTTFTPMAFPFSVYTFFYGFSLGPSLRELHAADRIAVLQAQWPVLAATGLVAGSGLLAGLARLRRRQWALTIWIVIPMVILSILALRNFKPFNPRYVATAFPWVLLLGAHGLLAFPRRLGQGLIVALLILMMWSILSYQVNPRYAKADVRGAAAEIVERGQADEPILVPVVTGVFKYYYTGSAAIFKTGNIGILRSREAVRTFFLQCLGNHQRCWVVLAREWDFDPGGWLPAILAEEGEILEERERAGIRIMRWKRSDGEESHNET